MFILGHFFIALANVTGLVLWAYQWLIIIRAVISWVNPDPYAPAVQFLLRVTEPVLEPIRRVLPPAGIDFSPVIALLGIMFLNKFLVPTLMTLGMNFL